MKHAADVVTVIVVLGSASVHPTAEYPDNAERVVTSPIRPSPYAEIRWWFG